MSANTYYTHPAHPDTIYKTQDANERRRLVRRGWEKQRRDDLERTYTRWDMCQLAEAPDGLYLWLTDRPADYRALRFAPTSLPDEAHPERHAR